MCSFARLCVCDILYCTRLYKVYVVPLCVCVCVRTSEIHFEYFAILRLYSLLCLSYELIYILYGCTYTQTRSVCICLHMGADCLLECGIFLYFMLAEERATHVPRRPYSISLYLHLYSISFSLAMWMLCSPFVVSRVMHLTQRPHLGVVGTFEISCTVHCT